MARIRTIKPEFPQSESIGRLSRDARLLFIQLWTIVDDDGRARGASRMLASLLYPYDDDAASLIDGWIAELEAAGKVRLYEVNGSTYIDIPNWLEHQKIDKPSKSRLPAFVDGSRIVANVREASTTDLGPSILDLGPGPIGSLRSPCAVGKPTRTSVPAELFDRFWAAYPRRGTASNPRKPALEKFTRLVKGGADPDAIIAGAAQYADVERLAGRAGTEKIAQAITWLNQERWRDYAEVVSAPGGGWTEGLPTSDELRAKYARAKSDRLGTEERVAERPPVDTAGIPARAENPGVVPRSQGFGGTRGLGEILSRARLLTVGVPTGRGLDGPVSVAGMADD